MATSLDMAAIRARLRAASGRRVLVYGDLMLDEYLFGRADRLSPEKPVPIVSFEHRDLYLGGAGNVVRNLCALGCEPVLVAEIGDDETGETCRDLLETEGVSLAGLVPRPGRTTPRKTRVYAGQHALVRIDYENVEHKTEDPASLVGAIERCAPGCEAAIVSDYRKGAVCPLGVEALTRLLRAAPTVADPKGDDAERYRGVDYLVPNESELAELTGASWTDESAQALRRRLDLEALVLTRSERGVTVFGPDRRRIDYPAHSRQVFDVTGAGDTFGAAMTAMLAAGSPIEEAVLAANAAAGIKVRRVGTAVVTPLEIEQELGRNASPARKSVDGQTAASAAAECRLKGGKVVFTNGCFDLLHAGHIRYLEASRRKGDLLIVGLNTDESVTRLKGPGRPILSETERAEILAGLSCIDLIVLFDEDTPLELIRTIRPDVLTKGADYRTDEVVGGDIVTAYGGRVELIDLVEGHSTTGIIGRIMGRRGDA